MSERTPEVWFRNPHLYIRECVELGASLIAWDRGYLVKKRIDPIRFGNLHYPASTDYRMLMVGDQGTAEVTRSRGVDRPAAVYPTWSFGHDDFALLEDWLANPVGEDEVACSDTRTPIDERPVLGQPHRVIITEVPAGSFGTARKFYGTLNDLQADFPEAIIHVHGLYSYNLAFGHLFGAVDIDPRTLASKGKVSLPSGKEVTFEDAAKVPQWVEVVGFKPADLSVPRNRCMFNMQSAQWAAVHFRENIKFRVRGSTAVDHVSPTATPPTTTSVKSKSVASSLGDKFLCDTCSLSTTCKYYRDGSVCSLPDSAPSSLVQMFKTRNSDYILNGLAEVMEIQVGRMNMGLRNEEQDGELSSEVTKIVDGLWSKGVDLAKLINPALTGKPGGTPIQINVQGQVAVGASPQEAAAKAMAIVEQHGYPPAEITAALIEAVIAGESIPLHPSRALLPASA